MQIPTLWKQGATADAIKAINLPLSLISALRPRVSEFTSIYFRQKWKRRRESLYLFHRLRFLKILLLVHNEGTLIIGSGWNT